MTNTIHNIIVVVAVSGVLSVVLAVYAYSIKSTFSGIRSFMWMSIFAAIYTFSYAFELTSSTVEEALRWTKAEYIGMPFIAPCCVLLTLQYVGLEKYVTRRTVPFFFVIPAITLLMVMTNEYHHLFYSSFYARPDAPTLLVDIEIGLWYIVHGSYTFGCLLFGGIMLIRHWPRTKSAYRPQLAVMILGQYIPMTAAFLYLIGLTPYGMDPVPVTISVTNTLYIWAIRTSGMLTVVPVARSAIFESMRDGVVVLDPHDRIADYNQAALRMMPQLGPEAIGQPVEHLALPIPSIMEQLRKSELRLPWRRADGEECLYQIHASPVFKGDNQSAGLAIVFMDITEAARMHQELRHLATTDGLTQIMNRTYFMHCAQELLLKTRQTEQPFAIILFDIDHFKSVNDTYGHDTGDAALRHVVSVCNRFIAEGQLFARYGGEEFVIGLPQSAVADAEAFAERVRAAIAASPLVMRDGELAITASFGVATPGSGQDTLAAMLSRADEALYAAKRGGRNTVKLAVPIRLSRS
ncbi:diguanylate cyclase (GGDEF)-like protein/PAS domain S-box-containing protein [Paenibacillus phyllosphaerae]|uniref:Diguanylate cyclase (GGDEF)-like protein/PAS domain S-box-containing protein n=1 Tax=Paenibacillus phyllosphaerae TaxID=274593 RepID=A0A7W5FN53_9BACL|nr:histidine kinase N-terminal 7TM domain-containing protein [Paenibacillus phyllosphaerae]MBB3110787.1 diguanylate cyclase (GGDEF)-like protein/PAS domain S-box-containing protein [Paenibacillus phyllosphaerae]